MVVLILLVLAGGIGMFNFFVLRKSSGVVSGSFGREDVFSLADEYVKKLGIPDNLLFYAHTPNRTGIPNGSRVRAACNTIMRCGHVIYRKNIFY